MSTHLDAWVELNQGGRFLDRPALETLPEPLSAGSGLADQLRDALTVSPASHDRQADGLGGLLDVVLEGVCALREGWRKGPAVGSADAERLLDGTVLKPRRLLSIGGETALVVFTQNVERIGLHKGRRIVSQVVEYLRRRKIPLGLVTNGREWRLLFADPDNQAWVEWAADRWLAADTFSPTLHLLRRVLSSASLTPTTASALITAIRATRRGQAALSKELGENVRKAVEHLLRARLPLLSPTWIGSESKSTYQAACHFVMRLVVVLFAEARELLPIDSPIYHQAYGLRGLLEALERAGADRRRTRTSAWPRLLGLFRLLHAGSLHPQIQVPTYGGELFRAGDSSDAIQRALALLESASEPPDDEIVYRLIVLLTRTTERVREGSAFRTVAAPVDFTELTSEYIGILYEGLLDYELKRVEQEPIVFLGLGDQPALPLDRLEGMSDKQLAALVEKAKVQGGTRASEDAGEDEDSDEGAIESGDTNEEAEDASVSASALVLDELVLDDARAEARRRALAWAERAALAGKLVKAPRGKKGKDDPSWKADVAKAAESLIVDLKLPGGLYLVRWGGTRKGAGTFYTRPQLTLPTVRRTLEPLITGSDGKVRTPEELLALKVCDPAMGSGSFLVAALRVLTEAVVTSLHVHGRIQKNGQLVRIECEVMPDADRDQVEERIEAIVRRAVVEHCLYGVDLDALAVELARVSLWVETLDRRLPFTFLDHKLRCGDALVGAWLDRFRDYPLLAWWRQSPDEKWRGVTHEGDTWAEALKEKRKQVVAEQAELLRGQKNWLAAVFSDEELEGAIERVRALYRRLRKVPATRPDERARIWREQVSKDPALHRVRQAFDTWCALWFWPLDRLDDAPGPAALHSPSGVASEVIRTLRDTKRFFHWELEFPDVFIAQRSGFDAIIANPPWETLQPQSKEYFTDLDPLYRSYNKQEALTRQREIFASSEQEELKWLLYLGSFKDTTNFVRHAAEPFGNADDAQGTPEVALVSRKANESRHLHERWAALRAKKLGLSDPEHGFRHQGDGKTYSYKLFLEQAYALARTGGRIGLVVPSGLYSDQGSIGLRRLLLEKCHWSHVYVFQNERYVFEDVHHSFKIAVISAAKGGKTAVLLTRFRLGPGDSPEADELPDDIARSDAYLQIGIEQLFRFSPNTISLFEIRYKRDLDILTRVYATSVMLGDDRSDGWGIRFAQGDFNMTSDSRLFVSREKAEQAGYKPNAYGQWIGIDGTSLLPVYQGVMIGMLDPNRASWRRGTGAQAGWDKKLAPAAQFGPQYLVARVDVLRLCPHALETRFLFRNIARTTDERTLIGCLNAPFPAGHSLSALSSEKSSDAIWLLGGILSSTIFDWMFRQRLGGTNLSWSFMKEAPVPGASHVHRAVRLLTTSLAATHLIFAPAWLQFVEALGLETNLPWKRQWAATSQERLRLRCMLDAIVAALYGLSLEDLRWVLRDCDHPKDRLSDKDFCRRLDPKGFWRIDKDEGPELRHPVLTLIAFEVLDKLITEHGGDRDAGITAFSAMNEGEGWMLPEMVRLADHGLGHDERAKELQPVASRLGPRFLDWQLAQTPEESWAECERHARAILGDTEFERRFGRAQAVEPNQEAARVAMAPAPASAPAPGTSPSPQLALFEPRPAAPPAATEPLNMSISSIRLLNFRNWTDEHWQTGIALKPITLVLGRNSAGKTSILQPLRMLKQTVEAADVGTHLHFGADLQDGVNLGAFADIVNGHDEKREMGVGLDLPAKEGQVAISVDVRFREVEERAVIDSLVYRLGEEKVELIRAQNAAYQLSSPRFHLPNWDGDNDVHKPQKAYEPGRAIEFSEQALKDLGPTLGPQVRDAMLAVKEAFKSFHYLGPLRPPPARTVTWSQQDPTRLGSNGSETVQALISNETGKNKGALKQAVSEWLQRIDHIADGIEMSRLGRTLLYQLDVIYGSNRANLADVGFGVSQVLPVIVLLHFVPEGSVVLCEDPEAHLHPMAQAGLADMFVEVVKKRRLQILVETHSEHLFRRLQSLIADGAIRHEDCALYYVERDQPEVKLRTLITNQFGQIANWPSHFFGDAMGETEHQVRKIIERKRASGAENKRG